jgi:predicted Fe-S protein YdhL (DUF1289 family)
MQAIDSPCTKVCTLHARVAVCTGCGRTLAEIERWPSLSPQERREAMAAIQARLETLRASDWRS